MRTFGWRSACALESQYVSHRWVHTLADSYVQASATMAGSEAEIASERKNSKYSELDLNTHFFVPIALETLGPINIAGHNFLSELGRCRMLATGDNRETCFLYQRLSIHHYPTFQFSRLSRNFARIGYEED